MQTANMSEIKKRATHAAVEVLMKHWVQDGEVELPVDATVIAERLGAEVFFADLSDQQDMAGFIYLPPGDGTPEITLNSKEHLHRRRFTCAHEVGHLMDPRENPDVEQGHIDTRATLSSAGTDPREVFANTFAAALLMPSDEVEWFAAEMDIYALARKFRVSTEAMENRLRTLGLKARG